MKSNELNNSGIYIIKNKINNKFYIGSAANLRIRFNDHKSDLAGNKHANYFLQNSYNKYGKYLNNFSFAVLEYCQIDKLLIREQEYLDKFYDNQEWCYNICPIAGSCLGMKHSTKTKLKMSIASKGKKKSESHRKKIKLIKLKKGIKLFQFDLDGNFVDFFPSLHEASLKTGITRTSINRMIKGTAYHANKTLWSTNEKDGPKLSERYYSRFNKDVQIIQWSLNAQTQIAVYKNHYIAAKAVNGNCTKILNICKKISDIVQEKNFLWSFIHEMPKNYTPFDKRKQRSISSYKPHTEETKKKISASKMKCSPQIQQLTLNGELIKLWDSAFLAAKESNFSYSSIIKCITGKRKSTGGFLWKAIIKE